MANLIEGLIGRATAAAAAASTSSSTSSAASNVKADIETLFNKIMSPIKKEADPNLVAQFCYNLNQDLDGAQIAIDLITNKMHSNQEWEAWIALYILEACAKNCGERFHDLIGRFRFLNEMIKIVSPKYYANRTSEKIKTKCIELIYSWSEGLPQKTKIKEAYDMLKRQGIVQSDPVNVDKLEISVPPRIKNPIFEDEEKSKQLTRLLKSKNPQDLELANRIIKNMVKQDEIKIEKTSNRINELEHINNNMKLLSEMLLNYNPRAGIESEKETIKYLYDELTKMRPNIVKLATECDENDESIGDILKTNDQCERILNQYKSMFDKDYTSSSSFLKFNDDVNLVNISTTSHIPDEFTSIPPLKNSNTTNSVRLNDDLIGNFNNGQKTMSYDPLKELQDLFITNNDDTNQNKFNTNLIMSHSTSGNNLNVNSNSLSATLIPTSTMSQRSLVDDTKTFSTLNSNNISKNPNSVSQASQPTPQIKAINELNELGRSLMEKSLNDPKTPLNAAVASSSLSFLPVKNLSLNEIQQQKSTTNNKTQPAANNLNDINSALSSFSNNNNNNISNSNPDASFSALNSLFVKLEDIKPGNVAPMILYDKNNFKIVLHFARDSPFPHIHVVVISATSSNTNNCLKNFSFQAAVPKSMKIKLQPASRTDLPTYNPILPPSAITQVMLIANPNREQIRLKYKLSYNFDDLSFNEPDELKTLPIAIDLL